jgi:methylenetetrahydrofolate reductase (NADPH)
MLRTALTRPHSFTITYELVPGQSCGGKKLNQLLEFARQAKEDGRIKALSITDNPGGNPNLAPVAIGAELLQMGIEPLIHLSLKDKNRSQISSHIYLYKRLQLASLLVLGGDFPKPSYLGQDKPVFDLDTIQTLQLIQEIEKNCCHPGHTVQGLPSHKPLLKGCVVSPFKVTEAEQVLQYAKLLYKIEAGADFIISQIGFDLRKFEELIRFLKQEQIVRPVLANVFIPSLALARAMLAGRVPGIVFPQALVASMEAEAAAGRPQARLDRAASMLVRLKQAGYLGVHLGGSGLNFHDICYVMDRFEAIERTGLFPQVAYDFPVPKTWYWYADQGPRPLRPGSKPGRVKLKHWSYHLLFSDKTLTSKLFGRFCRFCAQGKYRTALLVFLEKNLKGLLFNCRMCGDCTLPSSTYLCPQSGCPKQLLNGPCGGSRWGYCEVFPDRRCFWIRVYERTQANTPFAALLPPPLAPKNWALEQRSYWLAFFKRGET